MTCRHDVKRVAIDPSLLGEDKDMLEDLVAAAINDAVRRVEATTQEKMAGLDRRAAAAAGLQAAVLTDVAMRDAAMAASCERRRCAIAGQRAACPASTSWRARCAACPASGPRPRSAWRCICCSTIATARCALARALEHAPRTVRHCERCNTFTEDTVCALCRSAQARPGAAVRRRNARRPADGRADAGVSRACISC